LQENSLHKAQAKSKPWLDAVYAAGLEQQMILTGGYKLPLNQCRQPPG
jgi:hypothetical protein